MCVCVSRYMSDGGESGLRQLNAKIDDLKKDIEEKKEQRKTSEQRMKQLREQVTNAQV